MEFEISLRDLRFYAFHGVYEKEKITGNEFRVSLSVYVDFDVNVAEDDLKNTVSYADLFEIVKEEMEKPRNLLETVEIEIVKQIRNKFKNIKRGSISIEKSRPPIPQMIGKAEVTLNF